MTSRAGNRSSLKNAAQVATRALRRAMSTLKREAGLKMIEACVLLCSLDAGGTRQKEAEKQHSQEKEPLRTG